ncbi:MAG: hypothetical protein K6E36_07600 [Oscillospiraceae bacterium]|nr:hypothetical protein [Oscillospiraceae bacterium]MCR5306343.1 hypothetical protein [Oscillospiraceae bacterium]
MTEYLHREFRFGSYPQSPVSDRILRGRLAEAGGNPARWQELNPRRLYRDLTLSDERYRGITGGGAPQWFRFAPVCWRAVGRESRYLYLRAVHILDAQVFNRAVLRYDTGSGELWYRCPDPRARGRLPGWSRVYHPETGSFSDAVSAECRPYFIGRPGETAEANSFAGSCLAEWLGGSFSETAFSGALALEPADGGNAVPCRVVSLMIEGPQTRRFPSVRMREPVCLTPYAAAAGCETARSWYADGGEHPSAQTAGLDMSGDPCEIAGVQPVLQVYLYE